MKKFLITLFLFFISFLSVQAEEIFKITSANFDTSNSFVILNSPDETTQPILDEIKLIKLEEPQRAYFDIPSAILTIPKQDWNFNAKGITEIKISQFSTDPNVVRVVIYYDEDFNPATIKFLRLKNNLIIKFKESKPNDEYFHRTYRDEHSSVNDFYEYLTVEVPDNLPKENVVSQIQQAFNTIQKMDTKPLIKKDLKLNSKYYINQITPRNNGVLLSGFGSVTIEKPLILTNPSRIVYDIPNTLVNKEIRNSEYQLSETDSVKIGQFEVNKARIVITTPDVDKYIPIYSFDNQSLIITNREKINPTSLFGSTCDIIAYNKEKLNARTSSMILSFNHPVVHGIDRKNSQLDVYLYNVSKYNEEDFVEAFKDTPFENTKVTLMKNVGMKLSIPTDENSVVNTYLGSDSRVLKLQVTEPKRVRPVGKHAEKVVVLDAGHGGDDCGAIRDDITEKAITLDIAQRVKEILTQKGYRIEMTRDTDKTVSLQERVEFSEDINPDIFVSIHVNSSEKPGITGLETHYYHQESLYLAQTVHAALISNIKTNNRGLFKSKFYVINHTTAPAILVEIGFLSNASERADLVSEKRRQATAEAIAKGVQNYFK